MARLPLDFVQCVECSHVFNAAFDYAKVPYTQKPNRMFNRGEGWASSISAIKGEILRRLPERPVVIEIGHGDGSFLEGLAKACPGGTFIGFDPHGTLSSEMTSVRFYRSLFSPENHISEIRPDLIVSRHVLEHLMNPLGFVQSLSFATAWQQLEIQLYIEVPCIDRAIASKRTVDFYYEHNSQFTSKSFTKMLKRCGVKQIKIGHIYGGEVIYGLVRMGCCQSQVDVAKSAGAYRASVRQSDARIHRQLLSLRRSGKTVAIWGGTGKSAAFINRYRLHADEFPLVVDSDPDKMGTHVPGMGQEIRFRDWLASHPVDVVIIPPQWRAKDIVKEMEKNGIRVREILIEHEGSLIDYTTDDHPYR